MVQYTKRSKAIDRVLRSGRMGAIGHVSCIDRFAAVDIPVGADLPVEIARKLAARLDAVCSLLDWQPTAVISRITRGGATLAVQTFLEAGEEFAVHYLATFHGEPCGHELWIESSKGSLRTNGSSIWWRKRGWPIFAPFRLGLAVRGDRWPAPGSDDAVERAIVESSRCGESVTVVRQ